MGLRYVLSNTAEYHEVFDTKNKVTIFASLSKLRCEVVMRYAEEEL